MLMLETERLRLRQFTLADIDDYHRQLFSDPDVTKSLPFGKPISREETEALLAWRLEHWKRHGFGLWAVIYKQKGELIGQCGLQYLENTPEVELAYAIAKPYWGKGLTTEAVKTTLKYGFETIGLERIVAITGHTNLASQRVMTKSGLKYEKDAHYYGHDVVYYAISREEFTLMV
jgi:ribosomal-protein-alanine N-acetyltransferase